MVGFHRSAFPNSDFVKCHFCNGWRDDCLSFSVNLKANAWLYAITRTNKRNIRNWLYSLLLWLPKAMFLQWQLRTECLKSNYHIRGKEWKKIIVHSRSVKIGNHFVLEGFEHVVNVCVSNAVCDECMMVAGDMNTCETCGERQRIFHYDNSNPTKLLDDFINYLNVLAETLRVTCIAHYGGRYDSIELK